MPERDADWLIKFAAAHAGGELCLRLGSPHRSLTPRSGDPMTATTPQTRAHPAPPDASGPAADPNRHATTALLLGGALSALAAIAHLACIAIGAPAYRLMGAGEGMARAAEAGRWLPTVITLGIAGVLGLWAWYAWAAAGRAPRLPLMRLALTTISGVYLLRGLAFPLLMPRFPDNSMTFWLVSSGICLALGGLYAYGTLGRWRSL